MMGQDKTEYYSSGKKKFEVKIKSKGVQKIWYYENGKKKSKFFFDKEGTWIGMKEWNEQGKLLAKSNFEKERKKKGPIDLSNLSWTSLDTVSTVVISRENSNTVNNEINVGDTIIFHYKCLDYLGYEYDNSYERNTPLIMVVGKTLFLPAFINEVSKLRVEDKAYIRIPSKYGYGNKPAGNFPPNTTIVYFVEILKIKTTSNKQDSELHAAPSPDFYSGLNYIPTIPLNFSPMYLSTVLNFSY
ncbi:MAG: hypothetical protein A2W85_09260 [Bacteroidetes bacterium GWF2_41_31]|nr:MAG: hypothetical protein A2W85_09260 [Bacteroidetes bacterium GWF2_41_31]